MTNTLLANHRFFSTENDPKNDKEGSVGKPENAKVEKRGRKKKTESTEETASKTKVTVEGAEGTKTKGRTKKSKEESTPKTKPQY